MPPGQRRAPCPSTSLVAQTGYYLGDLSCPLGPLSYALCRPSGHHAHHDRASGFCYVNNNALAAQILAEHLDRVAVLDVDAHHGDGTQNIFYDRGDVLTVSTHADTRGYFPFYTGFADECGVGAGQGCNLNLPLAHGCDSAGFAPVLEAAVQAIADFAPRAVVLAIGFDTYEHDPISVLRFDFDAYRRVGERLRALGLPILVVQEGGYMVESLQPCLTALLEGLGAA